MKSLCASAFMMHFTLAERTNQIQPKKKIQGAKGNNLFSIQPLLKISLLNPSIVCLSLQSFPFHPLLILITHQHTVAALRVIFLPHPSRIITHSLRFVPHWFSPPFLCPGPCSELIGGCSLKNNISAYSVISYLSAKRSRFIPKNWKQKNTESGSFGDILIILAYSNQKWYILSVSHSINST